MGMKQGFHVLTFIALINCIASEKCPPQEDIPHCSCYSPFLSGIPQIKCKGRDTGYIVQDYKEALESVSGKYPIDITFSSFNKPHNISSRAFDGLLIKRLKFLIVNTYRWSDKESGPAFVGLENSLEILIIDYSIKRSIKHTNFSQEAVPFTTGHLRKLREIEFKDNDLYNIGNDWFPSGPKSLETLRLVSNKIYELGDEAFARLNHLKELDVNGNKIVEVSRSLLPKPALHLKELNFANNKLEVLPEDIFEDMPLLQRVHLNGNELKLIEERTWSPVWTQLDYVALNTNPLHCNDSIEWIFKVKVPRIFIAQCRYPDSMRDKYLKDLIKEREKN